MTLQRIWETTDLYLVVISLGKNPLLPKSVVVLARFSCRIVL